jgi:hypothetical protein
VADLSERFKGNSCQNSETSLLFVVENLNLLIKKENLVKLPACRTMADSTRKCPNIKLIDDGIKVHEILTSQLNQFGPFSKDENQSDVLVALRAIENGGEMKSNKVNKEHLFNIIKALITHQKWAELIEGESNSKENSSESNENGADLPYSREQKHVLLLKNEKFCFLKSRILTCRIFFFRNKTFLFVVQMS